MPGRRRTALSVEATRRNLEQLARQGGLVAGARHRRRLTQAELGDRVGLSRMAISRLERGMGGGMTMDAWQRIGVALGMPLRVEFARDPQTEPTDAGHLAIQELLLRLGRSAGYGRLVELPTRPAEPWRTIDVALADDRNRRLLVAECWNSFGDIGAAIRVSNRKRAEAEAFAIARWGNENGGVHLVWVIRATQRNRAVVARYPELFAAAFPGSSRGWVRALRGDGSMPDEAGLVWATVDASGLVAWRSSGRRISAAGPR